MEVALAKTLPIRHVRILLAHTCLSFPSTSTTNPPKSFFNYRNCNTHAAPQSITITGKTHSEEVTNRETEIKMGEKEAIKAQSNFRSEFLQVLRSRRPPQVPLTVELAKPVANPLPSDNEKEIMESCPKENIENFDDLLKEENLYLTIEEGDQGRLPVLILSLKESEKRKRPAIVFLHSTGKYKEYLRPLLEAYATRGYITIAIDSRYHGERATSATTYRDALISAWKTGETMPFIFDTVWDLIKLADYLTHREDIDPSRIGITGISLGGMHAWFAAAADTRYAVVAPLIGVQGFRWAIDNDKWQARVDSIKPVFEVARDDLGKSVIDKEVVEKVWDRIAPGLASQFDSPYSIPSIAPRPLLILNGAEDPRCPLAGLTIPISKARQAYRELDGSDNFKRANIQFQPPHYPTIASRSCCSRMVRISMANVDCLPLLQQVQCVLDSCKNWLRNAFPKLYFDCFDMQFIAEPGIGHQITKLQVKESSDWFDRFLKPQPVSSDVLFKSRV